MNYDIPATDDGILPALEHYIEVRTRIERDGSDWGELADCFTDDAVWSDCAWGRVEGKANIATMLREAMAGIDFENPIDFWAVDGPRVLLKWRQVLPGTKPDGGRWQQSAVTVLLYAGDGLFRYEEDIMNVAHCVEDIIESGWVPSAEFNAPPEQPDRNFDPAPTR